MLNDSTKVPDALWLAWLTQFDPEIFQLVAFQSLFVPVPEVVTVTSAVIEAEGATVTLVAPFKVAELIVLAAKAGEAARANAGTHAKKDTIYFRQDRGIK